MQAYGEKIYEETKVRRKYLNFCVYRILEKIKIMEIFTTLT